MGADRAGHVERRVAAIIQQEAVVNAGSIAVTSNDLARVVDPEPEGGGLGRGAGHVERGVAALIEQEAVGTARIEVISHDLARGVYPGSSRDIERARDLKGGVAALIEQEAREIYAIYAAIAVPSH